METQWAQTPGTYDVDGVLRVPPTQVRLIIHDAGKNTYRLAAPVAWTWEDSVSGQRKFCPFSTDTRSAIGLKQESRLGWVFVIGSDDQPGSILLRRLRLSLPTPQTDPQQLIAALGQPQTGLEPDQVSSKTTGIEATVKDGVLRLAEGVDLEVTDSLPAVLSANQVSRLTMRENTVVSGHAELNVPREEIEPQSVVEAGLHPSSSGCGAVGIG